VKVIRAKENMHRAAEIFCLFMFKTAKLYPGSKIGRFEHKKAKNFRCAVHIFLCSDNFHNKANNNIFLPYFQNILCQKCENCSFEVADDEFFKLWYKKNLRN
jgi:hypothetical protein